MTIIDDKNNTRFCLIRHGQTHWNIAKRIQGQNDSPLTANGEEQALAWGRHLQEIKFDRIITSDLGRAVQTVSLVNRTLKIVVATDPRLREQDWGEWVGSTLTDIEQLSADELSRQEHAGWEFRPPGGEDRNQLWKRSHDALLDAARQWQNQTILVVTHEGVIKSLLYRLCERKYSPAEPPLLQPRHLHWLIHDGKKLRVDKINAMPLSR